MFVDLMVAHFRRLFDFSSQDVFVFVGIPSQEGKDEMGEASVALVSNLLQPVVKFSVYLKAESFGHGCPF
jgi:hypothetical protein